MTGTSIDTSAFPGVVYVALSEDRGVESFDFAPALDELEDASGLVAVYRLESVGRIERTFVETDRTLEQ